MGKKRTSPGSLAENRHARHKYHLSDFTEAGVSLKGSEVKSIRAGRVQIRDAFVRFQNGEAFLWNAHIAAYAQGGPHDNHEPTRPRKLLLHKEELRRFAQEVTTKRLTVVPTRLYLKRGRIKVEIALARAKRKGDDREEIRRKIHEREARAAVRDFGRR